MTDRNWEAFRYVAGELSAEEAASFEARLENDPDLCDAVANAVEFGDSVVQAFKAPASRRVVHGRPEPIRWRGRRFAWLAVAAGLVAAVFTYRTAFQGDGARRGGTIPVIAELEPTVSPQLALAWTELRDELAAHRASLQESHEAEEPAEDLDPADEIARDEEAADAIPAWLLRATAGEKGAP